MGEKENLNKLSVVISAYNEKGNIEILSVRLIKVLKELNINYEVILVIDGNDGAAESMRNLIKKNKYKTFKISSSMKPRGFGNSFRKGFSMVDTTSSHILTMDADLNHRPEEIPLFINKILKTDSDIIVGSRYIHGSKMYKREFIKGMLSTAANMVFPVLFGLKVKDISSGYRLYKKQVISDCFSKLKTNNFEFLAEILYKSKKYHMLEIPINFEKRSIGQSKFNMFGTFFGYLRVIFGK